MDKHRLSRMAGAKKAAGARDRWYSFQAKGDTSGEVDLFIYDEIAWWAVSADDFVKDLAGIKADTINLRLNTPGGFVFDGMAIYNALKSHPARVVTHIDGLAASMGSIIALAGDEVRIAKTAFVMIHDPWSLVVGSAADMRKEADLLEKLGGSMAQVYAAKTGKSVEDIRVIMAAETWWTGDEAVAAGFADSIFNTEEDKAEDAAARFDLSIFGNAPERLLDAAHGAPERRKGELTKREVEVALREAGLSRNQAKALLAEGFKAVASREAEDDAAGAALADLVRKNIAILSC